MKKLLLFAFLLISLCVRAQNTWEMPKETAPKMFLDEKYASGAVTLKDDRVCFSKTIQVPGKTRQHIYGIVKRYLEEMTQESNQLQIETNYGGKTETVSRIVYEDNHSGVIAANFDEWLVFKNNAFVLDRTEMKYVIVVNCMDNSAEINITRIRYIYEKGHPGGFESGAEEVITDEWALNNNKTKLAPGFGKFRRKTIDRVYYIFRTFGDVVNDRQ